MRIRTGHNDSRRVLTPAARAGFTLVELLTVIAILALLITILVPAVGHVRLAAKKAACASTLQAISTGLETFRTDATIGGAYPPSFSDSDGSGGAPAIGYVSNPYGNGTMHVSGAGLLVWALAGADQIGSPGFRKVRSGSRFWAQDTDSAATNGGGSYYIDTSTGQPKYGRTGPLVDLSKVPVTPKNASGSYDVPAEKAISSGATLPRNYPMFLDPFGQPILYYRADPAGSRLADDNPFSSTISQNPPQRGIYHYIDNNELVGGSPMGGITPNTLKMNDSGKPHRLEFDATLTGPGTILNVPNRQGMFQYFIHNKSVTAKGTPQKPDSFLLISAGPDGRFGTTDDITNFNPNGSN
ncbi:MAG: type II secretion system protein [Phycisphaerae bacterium]